jgi:hypothetical protein
MAPPGAPAARPAPSYPPVSGGLTQRGRPNAYCVPERTSTVYRYRTRNPSTSMLHQRRRCKEGQRSFAWGHPRQLRALGTGSGWQAREAVLGSRPMASGSCPASHVPNRLGARITTFAETGSLAFGTRRTSGVHCGRNCTASRILVKLTYTCGFSRGKGGACLANVGIGCSWLWG